jgi:hypothetical protein
MTGFAATRRRSESVPTPRAGYYAADGTRLPGVTTVLYPWHPDGIEQLLGWANRLGREGKCHTEARDRAADSGTLCHAAIESWIKGQEPDWQGDEAIVAKAKKAFEGFLRWADGNRFRITHTETPLISERHRFGGTPDAAMYQNLRVLCDWKTSGSIRASYLVQVGGGYRILWEENFPDDPLQGFMVLRFDREFGDFHAHYYPELDGAREAFLLLRRLYELSGPLKRRVL